MMILAFLKVFSDLCVCFAVMGAFPGLFVHSFPLWIPGALGALGVGLAAFLTESGRWPMRFAGMIFPLASLFLMTDSIELLTLCPVIAYSCVLIFRGELTLEYYSFREFFKKSLIFLVCYFIAVYVFSYFEKVTGGAHRMLAYNTTFCYSLAHGFVGILLLRQLRLGDEAQGRKLNRRQTLVILGGGAVAAGAVMLLDRFFHEDMMDLLEKGVAILVSPIVFVTRLISRTIMSLEGFGSTAPTATGEATVATNVTVPMPTGDGIWEEQPTAPAESDFPWVMAALLIMVIIAMIVMLRTFKPRRSVQAANQTLEKLQQDQRDPNPDRRSNRSRIRKYYRDFLRTEQKRGMDRRPDQTSANILEEISASTDAAAAARLREIYLQARYDPNSEPTPQQTAAAKAALKKTK